MRIMHLKTVICLVLLLKNNDFLFRVENLLVFIADKNIVSQYNIIKNDRLLKGGFSWSRIGLVRALYAYDYRGTG